MSDKEIEKKISGEEPEEDSALLKSVSEDEEGDGEDNNEGEGDGEDNNEGEGDDKPAVDDIEEELKKYDEEKAAAEAAKAANAGRMSPEERAKMDSEFFVAAANDIFDAEKAPDALKKVYQKAFGDATEMVVYAFELAYDGEDKIASELEKRNWKPLSFAERKMITRAVFQSGVEGQNYKDAKAAILRARLEEYKAANKGKVKENLGRGSAPTKKPDKKKKEDVGKSDFGITFR